MKQLITILICLFAIGCNKITFASEPLTEKKVVLDRQKSLSSIGESNHAIFLSDCEKYQADLNVIMFMSGNATYSYNISILYGEVRDIVNPYSGNTIANVEYDGNCKVNLRYLD